MVLAGRSGENGSGTGELKNSGARERVRQVTDNKITAVK